MWTCSALLMAAEVELLFELRLKHSFGAFEFLLQLPCSTASSEREPNSAASAAPPAVENSRGWGLRQLTAFDSAFHHDTRARDVKSLLREREREKSQIRGKLGPISRAGRAQSGRGGRIQL